MTTYDKMRIILSLTEATDFNQADIKIESVGNQSIKIIHPCGCYFVQHIYAGKIIARENIDQAALNKINIDRLFFAELCKQHKDIAISQQEEQQ